jgi:hypothetical protein
MADTKSENKTMLNYTIQPFAGQFFVANLPVELYGRKFQFSFFSLKPSPANLFHFYFAFDPT